MERQREPTLSLRLVTEKEKEEGDLVTEEEKEEGNLVTEENEEEGGRDRDNPPGRCAWRLKRKKKETWC